MASIKRCLLFIYFILFVSKYSQNITEILISLVLQKRITIKLKNGLLIHTSKNNTRTALVYREIFMQQVYTPAFMPIKRDDIIIDIGSDIGIFSLFAATKTTNQIFAYEPSKDSFKLLQKNVLANNIKNINCYNLAVSHSTQPVKFYVNSVPQMNSLSPLAQNTKLSRVSVIHPTTLEKIIASNKIQRVGFLKIDCEGAEGQIIKSTPPELYGKIDKIAIEFHDYLSLLSHTQIMSVLKNAGYTVKLKWNRISPFGYIYAYK